MNQRTPWNLNLALPLAAGLLLCAAGARAATPEQLAARILKDAQVTGGLVVHLGCGDTPLTAALRADPSYLVQGLDRDREVVLQARRRIRSLGLYGQVTVDTLVGNRLPYLDNLVNLVLVEEPGDVPASEVMRVLRPGGVAFVKQAGGWKKSVKPRPGEIDEWTHFLHGPDNNAVGHDQLVDIPRHLKWLGKPKFARAHEQLASMSGCVTTGGRLFYIIDEAARADVRFPSRWFLVARDAFNGVVLWKRPIPTWADQLRRFRSGPAETAFRLAARDDRLYVTLGIDAPVSILDALTGRTLADCEATGHARQVLRIDDKLVALIDTRPQVTEEEDAQIRKGLEPAPGSRAIVAADAATGKMLWRKEIDAFVHPTLCAHGGRVFYQTNQNVFCLSLDAGEPIWRSEAPMRLSGHELGWESPTLVADDRAVYCADFKNIIAFSSADGRELWRGPSQSGYNSPPDVFLIGDLVWTKGKAMVGRDRASGEVKREIPAVGGYMHDRCYRNKATDRFFILGEQGVQFIGLESGDARLHHWIRGTCQYGIMPANGLLYVTPDSCACNMKSKLAGFWALSGAAGDSNSQEQDQSDTRLEKGPAFGRIEVQASSAGNGKSWPVFRHDFARSGLTEARVPTTLARAWQTKIGGRLSGITAADGKVFVGAVDEQTVYALDEQTGAEAWTFTAGGRIDSPPTIYRGMTLFGSADGWVYAVRSSDGDLIWRFRAAPHERRTFVNGQLESVWPVHGSVLVHDGKLIVAAGRSSYLDGGIRISRVDPLTGQLLSETPVYSPDPETDKQPKDENIRDVRGLLSDILVAGGSDVYMRHVKLDLETGDETASGLHLFSPIGLLDDTWWHRGYWVFHDEFIAHWSGWWKVGNYVPSGRILCYDESSIFGYGRDKYPGGNTGQWRGGEHYRLFACDRPTPADIAAMRAAQPTPQKGRRTKPKEPVAKPNRWNVELPLNVRAMLVAGDTIFIAGPPELIETVGTEEEALLLENPEEPVAAWQGAKGGYLWAVSSKDGKRLSQRKLEAPPVFDGMAATEGRLYMATVDGNVICHAE